MKKSNQKSLGSVSRGPHASVDPAPETLRIPGAGLDDTYKVFILIQFLLGLTIKCAAGTLRAYLRRRTDDVYIVFVSSRSLSVRGSWGTAPSVFCLLLHEQK